MKISKNTLKRSISRLVGASALTVALALPSLASAAVPNFLTHQGRLYDAAGLAINDTLSVTYTIYNDGGMPVWTETHNVVFSDGYYATELGTITPIDVSALAAAGPLELGIQIANDPELSPRSAINSVAYALVANDAVGDINPTSVTVGGTQVINSAGEWVGNPTGLVGATGPVGAIGPTGADGVAGAAGAVGPTGPAGAAGAAGAVGPTGPAGAAGAVGVVGPTGPAGAAGAVGATGPAGAAGAAGAVGPTGPAGAAGAAGAVGPTGPAGAAGAAGAVGPTGPAGAAGAAGAVGPTGPAGAAGAAGAVGPTGPAGAAGAAGAVGPTGPAGAAGAVGPAGPAGAAGAAGAVGPTGPAGAVGPAGPAGAVGPAGPAGAAGAVGPTGPAGAAGAIGPTGATGVVQIVTASAAGSNVTTTLAFIGPTVSVTVAAGQKVHVVASKALGTTSALATSLNVYPCYQPSGGAVTPSGGGLFGLAVTANIRLPVAINGVFIGLAAGTYAVGMCGSSTNAANWNNNDFGYTSAFVTN